MDRAGLARSFQIKLPEPSCWIHPRSIPGSPDPQRYVAADTVSLTPTKGEGTVSRLFFCTFIRSWPKYYAPCPPYVKLQNMVMLRGATTSGSDAAA
jgi:hypothetical protein